MAKFRIIAQQWDQITSKPNEPLVFVRHRAGDVVDIPKAEADRLLKAGAIESPGRARAAAAAAAAAESAVNPQAPPPVDPPAPAAAEQPPASVAASAADPERPKLTATTQVWQEYAIARGMDPDEVADMGRDELHEALS